jgi:RNA polymerase sigma-70 factor (ECF subfamily)
MRCTSEVVAWVGSNIVPHEGELRAWLRRVGTPDDEIDDLVQEAYVRLAQLSSVSHIRNGKAYLFTTARSVMLQRLRREQIVRIEMLAEVESLNVADAAPSPERQVGARMQLEQILAIIDQLPDRCREIFRLRRIEGVPQKEIAARLRVPEHIVEAEATRGLKQIMKRLAEGGDSFAAGGSGIGRRNYGRGG